MALEPAQRVYELAQLAGLLGADLPLEAAEVALQRAHLLQLPLELLHPGRQLLVLPDDLVGHGGELLDALDQLAHLLAVALALPALLLELVGPQHHLVLVAGQLVLAVRHLFDQAPVLLLVDLDALLQLARLLPRGLELAQQLGLLLQEFLTAAV